MATTETVQKILVGGEWYETGETIDVTSPYDGSVVGRVAYGGADDARRAIDAAERAMREPVAAHRRGGGPPPAGGGGRGGRGGGGRGGAAGGGEARTTPRGGGGT